MAWKQMIVWYQEYNDSVRVSKISSKGIEFKEYTTQVANILCNQR